MGQQVAGALLVFVANWDVWLAAPPPACDFGQMLRPLSFPVCELGSEWCRAPEVSTAPWRLGVLGAALLLFGLVLRQSPG